MRSLLVAAYLDEIALNFLENQHPLIGRAIYQKTLTEVVSIIIYH